MWLRKDKMNVRDSLKGVKGLKGIIHRRKKRGKEKNLYVNGTDTRWEKGELKRKK